MPTTYTRDDDLPRTDVAAAIRKRLTQLEIDWPAAELAEAAGVGA